MPSKVSFPNQNKVMYRIQIRNPLKFVGGKNRKEFLPI